MTLLLGEAPDRGDAAAHETSPAAPSWRSLRLWRNLTLFWAAHSLVSAQTMLTLTGGGPTPENVKVALVQSFGTWMPWVPLSVFLVELVRRYPLERGRLLTSLAMLGLGFVAAVVAKAAYVLAVNGLVGWYAQEPAVGRVLIASLFNNLLMYWLVVGVAHALIYAARYRQRESEVTALRASLSEARLQALSAQLNPHFLFNALNSIAEMVHHDADAADRMLVQLGGLLRHSLESGRQQHTSLQDELGVIDCYIGIEQVRLGERLQFRREVRDDVLSAQVPRLMLQPLVENAVAHAVAHRQTPSKVEVRAWREGERLVIEVLDEGSGSPPKPGFGLGIANTRARLECLYGEAQSLDIVETPGGGTRVRVSLPYAPSPAG